MKISRSEFLHGIRDELPILLSVLPIDWRTKNVLLTIFVGMACLLILQAFIPHY